MADFSGAGLLDLPATTAESLQRGDTRVLGWLMEAIKEGDAINRADPSYDLIERAQAYVVGEQLPIEQRRLQYLPQIVVNETRKAMQSHVSALTDLKPIFGWRSDNPVYRVQADLLNRYAIAEWVSTLADLDLGDCIKICLVGGTGDLVIDWDPHAPMGGAHQFSARDPRDTLPIRPSLSRSPQSWEGVIFREEHSVNVLKAMYPTKASLFKASADSVLSKVAGKFRTLASRFLTPSDPLDSVAASGSASGGRRHRAGSLVLYRANFRDRTRNLTGKSIPMGTPGTAHAYLVEPNAPLYPRGRLVVFTDDVILYDGPNIYWHGMHPFARLKLWSVPWQFLGIPLFNDLLPVQDAINKTHNDVRLGIEQWMNPDLIYNRNAVSEPTMRLIDPRRPGKKLKTNPSFGEPYKKDEGPNPQVLALAVQYLELLTGKFTDLSGTANLSALLQLRQLPSADTIQKYYEALTPEIRQEGRMVEAFLRDLAEIVKVNYFQFLSKQKRVNILGDAAATLSDFDYDPDMLVPALSPGDQGYTPELDPTLTTRDQRAQFFHKQFIFLVSPNSLLAMNAQERKMMTVQLAREGLVDFWTLHETLETPNVGAPPEMPLPPLEPPPPGVELALASQAQQLIQQMATQVADAQLTQPGVDPMASGAVQIPAPPEYTDPTTSRTFTLDPASGKILEIRVPTTITERLQAQMVMGIAGMGGGPAAGGPAGPGGGPPPQQGPGRKASGQAPPKQETKNDRPGGRTTITESEK